MSKNAQDGTIAKKLKTVDRLQGISKPANIVMVTVEDVIEIFHEIQPYTMTRLDDLEAKEDSIREAKVLAEKVLSL